MRNEKTKVYIYTRVSTVIIECSPEVSLDAICEQMGRTPPWIPGIELRADGYECTFYQKQ